MEKLILQKKEGPPMDKSSEPRDVLEYLRAIRADIRKLRTDIQEMKAKQVNGSRHELAQKDAYSIDEFCERQGMSRCAFYNAVKAGEGPDLMKVGARTMISREAIAHWHRSRELAGMTEEGSAKSAERSARAGANARKYKRG